VAVTHKDRTTWQPRRASRREGSSVSVPFEIPRLRVIARHALPNVIEGTIIPVGLFLLMLRVVGVWGAMLVGLGWSYTAVARRVATGRPVPGIMLLSAITLTARSLLAVATGSVFVYFLQPTLGTALVAGTFLVSVPLGRPLAQRLATDFCPIPAHFMADSRVRQFFLRISLLWALTGFINAALALWLQVSQSVGAFVLIKTLASASLTITAIAVSVVWFKRSMLRHGLLHPRVARAAGTFAIH
jgi:hypothetical protein